MAEYRIKEFNENDEESSLITETVTETIERIYSVADMRRRIIDIDEDVARQLKYREELLTRMNALLAVLENHKKGTGTKAK